MDRRDLLLSTAALALGIALPGCASAVAPTAPGAATPSPAPSGANVVPGAAPSPGLDDFATSLMRTLAPSPANVVFSPWSIAMVLSMVREGAVGGTASELDALLGLGAPAFGDDLAARAQAMAAAGDRLRGANCVWGQRDLAWKAAFLSRLAGTYRAPLRESDFRANGEAAREEINAWVNDQTRGKIPQLLTPGLIRPSTRLVLVNALHFKAPWFDPLTELGPLPFTTADGRTVQVPSLTGGDLWHWWDHGGLVGTAMPCEGMEFALVLVQPKDAATAVPASAFGKVLAADVAPVTLQLPAWKLRFRALLNDPLQKLGVRLAFDDNLADFSGMTDAERLVLDFVVHEATIEVNAKGIEAAAATAAGMRDAAGVAADPQKLILDRPFSYALVHVPTTTCLFVGQVADPTIESVS